MNTSDCIRIDDSAAYVLNAMDEGELEVYRYHVSECEVCAAKVAELEYVAHALLSGVPQMAAPSDMRERVMSVVRSEAELLKAAGAGADRPEKPRSPSRLVWLARMRPLPAVALACVALALGLGAGSLLTGENDPTSRTVIADVNLVAAPGAKAEMRMASGTTQLVVHGMPAPPDGRIYQVWLNRAGDHHAALPTDALFSTNREGKATVQVPGDLKDVSAVMVTSEPAGGSKSPTSAPVITATL